MSLPRSVRYFCLLVAIGIAASHVRVALAQNTPITPDAEEGMKPYGAFNGGDIDRISLDSGKLVLDIPLISYPQRGGKINVGYKLTWKNISPWIKETCRVSGCSYIKTRDLDSPNTGGIKLTDDLAWSVFGQSGVWARAAGPDGDVHQMVNPTSSNLYRSIDGSGLVYNFANSTLQMPNGSMYAMTGTNGALSKVEDANGNFVTKTAIGWTDTMGRAIPTTVTSTTDYSGCTGSTAFSSASVWAFPAPGGGTENFKFCYAFFPYSFTINDFTNPVTISGSISLLESIVLPNLTTWTFQYDPSYASLSQITLPTGGTIAYTWAISAVPCTYTQTVDNLTETTTTSEKYTPSVTSRTVNANDGGGSRTWTYSGTTAGLRITDPSSNDSIHVMTGLGGTGSIFETQAKYYQGSYTTGTLLKTVTTDYTWNLYPFYNSTIPAACNNVASAFPIRVTISWPNNQTSKTETDYDAGFSWTNQGQSGTISYGLPIAQRSYDYGSGAPGSLIRQTLTTYMALSGPNAATYLANNLLKLPYTVQLKNGAGTQVAFKQFNYDETTRISSGLTSSNQFDPNPPTGNLRGNATTSLRWLNTGTMTCPSGTLAGSGSNVAAKSTYFDTGMINTVADPCTNTTTYSYSTTYWAALPTTVTNAISQSITYIFDFNTSLLTSSTDPNGLVTSYSYDSMRRLASITSPLGDITSISHQESSAPFTATLSKPINPSQSETSTNVFDGLGRLTQSKLTSDPQGIDYTDTTYDALGRVATVSNPYRTGTDITTTTGITTDAYDGLNRKLTETYPDGSILRTAYCGSWTLVTDPTGRWRRSHADALGRLVEVDEPNSTTASVASTGCPGTGEPIWVTTYSYDTLDNLVGIVQNGSRSRSFTYDSFSRMLTSTNPEVGTITYTYNPDGPVLTKKDARNITTTYLYDALHRVTSVSYSNGDPTITMAYDQPACLGLSTCHNKGQRTSMTDGAGSEAWSYQADAPNHRSVHVNQRTTKYNTTNITKTSTYYFDFAGNVTQAIYPTGRVVNYTYSNANRPSTATDGSNGITYATGLKTSPGATCLTGVTCYTPQGTFYALSIGQTSTFTGLNLTHSYNNRLQPLEFKAQVSGSNAIMDIYYNFVDTASGKNAGHVNGITNNIDATRSQTFAYDQLNRIISAQTTSTFATSPSHCWGEVYSLDSWGNLNSIAATTNSSYTGCSQESGFSQTADANNHLPSFSYDSAGNTLTDGINSYAWDAESQMKSSTQGGTTTAYTYDGSGRRVSKSSGKIYWYGSGGEILAETDTTGAVTAEYIFFGGKRIAMVPSTGTPIYYVSDMLGSSRVVTNNLGVTCYDADFYPYGGERSYTNTCPQNVYKFEGKERDLESGNDNFGARSYSNRFGRWLSADWSSVPVPVPYANLTNPQTLNLYSMVGDDPETFADLDGHTIVNHGPMQGESLTFCADAGVSEPCGLVAQHSADLMDEAIAWTESQVAQDQANANAKDPQNQTQNQLSVTDVTKIIQQAQKSGGDPVSTGMQIFNGLGSNASVTGDVLRQAIKESKVDLGGAAADLIQHADSVTKSGSNVTITNSSAFSSKQGDVTINFAKTVSFSVGADKKTGLPGFSQIQGLSGKQGKLGAGVTKIQVVQRGDARFARLDLSVPFVHPEIALQ